MMVEDFRPEAVDPDDLAVWFSCDDELLTRKVAAMRAQASQIDPTVRLVGEETFSELVREECFRERRPGDQALVDQHRNG